MGFALNLNLSLRQMLQRTPTYQELVHEGFISVCSNLLVRHLVYICLYSVLIFYRTFSVFVKHMIVLH